MDKTWMMHLCNALVRGIYMKLRNKLKISFCIMVILPVIMCSIFAYAFFKYQATTIHQLYEVDSGELLDNFYSPVVLHHPVLTAPQASDQSYNYPVLPMHNQMALLRRYPH